MPKNVAVIGASISGLGTAHELLRHNPSFTVTIYERKKHPGTKLLCGGVISEFMVRELRLQIPKHAIACLATAVRIYSPNGKYCHLESEKEVYAYVLWRGIYEDYLYRQVRRMGGKFKLGCQVIECRNLNEIVVAADGVTGACRKQLGLKLPEGDDLYIGVQRLARLSGHPTNRIDLYFGSTFAPEAYAWIIPDGMSGLMRVGLGVPVNSHKNPVRLLKRFTDFLGAEPQTPVRGKLVPAAMPDRKLVYNNVLLVGDAGLLCDPVTGGGIANGLLSGRYAARAILEDRLERYPRYCASIKRRNKIRYGLKQVITALSDCDFNDLVEGLQTFNPKITRISWALAQAVAKLTLAKPKLFAKHGLLRKVMRSVTKKY